MTTDEARVYLGDSGAYCRPCAGCDEVTQACRDAGCGAEVNIDFDVLNAKIRTDVEARLARFDAVMTLSHEDYADALSKVMAVADAEHAAEVQRREDVADEYQKAGRSWDTSRARLTKERDEALDALGRIGGVLFMHSHADTCAAELSPDAGYECSCWRAGIYAALKPRAD